MTDTTETEYNEEELNKIIENLCWSKSEEFKKLGYEALTGKDIWDCAPAEAADRFIKEVEDATKAS